MLLSLFELYFPRSVIIHQNEQVAPFLRFVVECRPIYPEPSVFFNHRLRATRVLFTDQNMLVAFDNS